MFEKFWLGPTDLVKELMKSISLPESIILRDCTLREGEQAADITLSVDDKVHMAKRLEAIGITRIQGGMPGRSDIDKKVFERLNDVKLLVDATILAYTLNWKEEIDAAISLKAKSVDIVFPCSEYRLKKVMNLSQNQMLNICRECIVYAKEKGLRVSFGPSDTTRTSLKFLREIGEMAVETGADNLTIADTVGVAIPETMRLIVRTLRDLRIELGVHTHNDIGLALANALAAVQEGARVVDVTVNGLGERAGGVALDEFVVVAQEILGRPLGIKTEELYELSKFFEELTGFSIPPTKPLIGNQAFAHKLDTHIQGVMKYMPAYQGLNPELIGRKVNVVIGNLSGPFAIKTKAQELGIEIKEDSVDKITESVRKKSIELRRALRDKEFIAIVSNITKRKEV